MPEQDREVEQAGWVSPEGDMHALLFHQPEGPYPVRLGFTTIGVEGVAITVRTVPQQPYLLMLDDYNARSAAITILEQFGVDFDADEVS